MITVAGIDVSSHAVDVVLLDDDTDAATWHRYPLTGQTPFERARSLRDSFPTRSWWEDAGCYLVGLEDPQSRFPHVAKALGLATGAVAALLPADLTVVQTRPQEWKQLTVGKAGASKVQVARWALSEARLFRNSTGATFLDWPQDALDAYAIARAVRRLNMDAIARQKGAA